MAEIIEKRAERFCNEYLKDFNVHGACKRAGYPKGSDRVLKRPDVVLRIRELSEIMCFKARVNATYVLRQACKIHERCMQEIEPVMVREGGRLVQKTDAAGRPIFKFDAAAAIKALEVIGKHIEIQAFSEKQVVEHTGTVVHDTTALNDEVLKAVFERKNIERRTQVH